MSTDRSAVQYRGGGEPRPISGTALWWGVLLVVSGAFWLADATAVIDVPPVVVGIFFALAGLGFAVDFATEPRSWWAAIPAGALLGLGTLIAFVEGTTAPDEWGASMLLGGTGLGFLAVYLRNRAHWWAVIPGGLLLMVTIIVAIVPIVDRGEGIAVVVLGILAAALVAVSFVPIRGRRMLWLIVPAAILAVVAGFLAFDAIDVLEPYNWVSPAALLVIGLFVVFRALSGRGSGRQDG